MAAVAAVVVGTGSSFVCVSLCPSFSPSLCAALCLCGGGGLSSSLWHRTMISNRLPYKSPKCTGPSARLKRRSVTVPCGKNKINQRHQTYHRWPQEWDNVEKKKKTCQK